MKQKIVITPNMKMVVAAVLVALLPYFALACADCETVMPTSGGVVCTGCDQSMPSCVENEQWNCDYSGGAFNIHCDNCGQTLVVLQCASFNPSCYN